MKKYIQLSAVILMLALSFTGCTLKDHVPQEKLELNTMPVEFNNGWEFNVEAVKLGDLPVKEYGILYLSFFRASSDNDYVPRIEHGGRMKFDSKLMQGVNTQVYKTAPGEPDAFAGRYFFYYRAYAILGDGSVIYGGIYNYTFPR